jgi:hypothetical protein
MRVRLANVGTHGFGVLPVWVRPLAAVKILDGYDEVALAPGETADPAFRFSFSEDACWNPLIFQIDVQTAPRLREGLGNLEVPAACSQRPLMWLGGEDYVGGDGDDVPEPGETLSVAIALHNGTRESPYSIEDYRGFPAKEVTGTLLSQTLGIRILRARSTWPDIAPHQVARNVLPFVVEIASTVPRAPFCQTTGFPGPPPRRDLECRPALMVLELRLTASRYPITLMLGHRSKDLGSQTSGLAALLTLWAVVGAGALAAAAARRRHVLDRRTLESDEL